MRQRGRDFSIGNKWAACPNRQEKRSSSLDKERVERHKVSCCPPKTGWTKKALCFDSSVCLQQFTERESKNFLVLANYHLLLVLLHRKIVTGHDLLQILVTILWFDAATILVTNKASLTLTDIEFANSLAEGLKFLNVVHLCFSVSLNLQSLA